jgi:hypothetical protein
MVIMLVLFLFELLVDVIYIYPVHAEVGCDVSIGGIRREEARDI